MPTPKVKSKKEHWYRPQVVNTGWTKDLGVNKRRQLALKAHKGDLLATARALQALANTSKDRTAKKLARQDASYFYNEYHKVAKK